MWKRTTKWNELLFNRIFLLFTTNLLIQGVLVKKWTIFPFLSVMSAFFYISNWKKNRQLTFEMHVYGKVECNIKTAWSLFGFFISQSEIYTYHMYVREREDKEKHQTNIEFFLLSYFIFPYHQFLYISFIITFFNFIRNAHFFCFHSNLIYLLSVFNTQKSNILISFYVFIYLPLSYKNSFLFPFICNQHKRNT